MKKFLLYSVALLTSATMITSCLGDLDAEPLAESTITADKAFEAPESYDQYVNYAYSYFSLVSQGDPGKSDIAVSDAGQSEFIQLSLTQKAWEQHHLSLVFQKQVKD